MGRRSLDNAVNEIVGMVPLLSTALSVDALLLFPAVVEDLKDAECAWDEDEGENAYKDDSPHVDPVDAVMEAVIELIVVIVPLVTPIGLPILLTEGIDHDDDEGDESEDGRAKIDPVQNGTGQTILWLDGNPCEQGHHEAVPAKLDPSLRDAGKDGSKDVQGSDQESRLSEIEAPSTAGVSAAIDTHSESSLINNYNLLNAQIGQR